MPLYDSINIKSKEAHSRDSRDSRDNLWRIMLDPFPLLCPRYSNSNSSINSSSSSSSALEVLAHSR